MKPLHLIEHSPKRQSLRKHLSLLIACTLVGIVAWSQTVKTSHFEDQELPYHLVKSKAEKSRGLLIYMHGGVSQFKGEQPQPVEITDLLEGNNEFVPALSAAGYDLLLPIAFNQYNWLEEGGERWINHLIDEYQSQYPRIYISGFSDGGTGAYRIFYNNVNNLDGVLIFNGYPQLGNFHKKVDHKKVMGKKVLYCGTSGDKVIPYEFMLVEFRRQQMVNRHTYFYLKDGQHRFGDYNTSDFELMISHLNIPVPETDQLDGYVTIYPPVDGLIRDQRLLEVYPFRKKKGKQYLMANEESERSDYDHKEMTKLIQSHVDITLRSKDLPEDALTTLKVIPFEMEINGKKEELLLNNWLNLKTW